MEGSTSAPYERSYPEYVRCSFVLGYDTNNSIDACGQALRGMESFSSPHRPESFEGFLKTNVKGKSESV